MKLLLTLFILTTLVFISSARWDGQSCGYGMYVDPAFPGICWDCQEGCMTCSDDRTCTECYP